MLITIVLAVKNEARHIQEALNSILAQEEVTTEVIVVDDGSTDDTRDILKSYSSKYSNLKLALNPGCGKVSAFNYGVSLAKGDYVCLFAGDDKMPRGSLALRFKALATHFGDRPIVGLSKIVTMCENKKYDGQVIPRAEGRGSMSGQSPLMNRRALDIIFPVPEQLPNEDTWMELALSYLPMIEKVHSNTICCQWRIHEGNTYNIMIGFVDYKAKLVERLAAYPLFLSTFSNELPENAQSAIGNIIKANHAYRDGSVLGLMFCPVGLTQKLRHLSTINPYFYQLRKALYRLLSGW